MNKKTPFFYAILILGLNSISLKAQDTSYLENSFLLGYEKRNNSKYKTDIFATKIEVVNEYGKFQIEGLRDTGLGRINSNDNIFGFNNFIDNPWKNFKGNGFKLGYGAKTELYDGNLYLGFGFGKYLAQSSTITEVGDKRIDMDGKKLFLKWEKDNLTFTTKYLLTSYDIQVNNLLSISPLPLIQKSDIKDEHIYVEIENNAFRFILDEYKNRTTDIYDSSLLPINNLNTKKDEFTLMSKFSVGNNSILLGPKCTTGRFGNSIVEMKIKNKISGLALDIENTNKLKLAFNYNSFFANGKKSYLIGDPPLTEEIKLQEIYISLGKISYKTSVQTLFDWRISGSYYLEQQVGHVSSVNPTLIFITGGSAHKNAKEVERSEVNIYKALTKSLNFNIYYKTEKIEGQIYTNNPLYEKSNSLGANLTYTF